MTAGVTGCTPVPGDRRAGPVLTGGPMRTHIHGLAVLALAAVDADTARTREVHVRQTWVPDGQAVPAGLVAPSTRSGLNQRDEGLSSASTRDRIDRAIFSTG